MTPAPARVRRLGMYAPNLHNLGFSFSDAINALGAFESALTTAARITGAWSCVMAPLSKHRKAGLITRKAHRKMARRWH